MSINDKEAAQFIRAALHVRKNRLTEEISALDYCGMEKEKTVAITEKTLIETIATSMDVKKIETLPEFLTMMDDFTLAVVPKSEQYTNPDFKTGSYNALMYVYDIVEAFYTES